ncbi:MAG TPA: DUF4328 domain-containing protein [Pyrinomonadaceae bacterium]
MATTENQTRTPALLTANAPFASGHGRAQVVVFLFLVFIAVAAFSVFSNLLQLSFLSEAAEAGGVSQEAAEMNDTRQGAVWIIHLVVRLTLMVAFLLWLHRASGNMAALGNAKSKIEYTPGWAVGSFFIPFANLFMPYRAVSEVWVKSEPPVQEEGGLAFAPHPPTTPVLAWWVTWLASNFIGRAASRFGDKADTIETLQMMTWAAVLADVLSVVAAVLAVMVVRSIDRRQEERARHVVYSPDSPPPPPPFRPQPQTAEPHEAESSRTPPPSSPS